MDLNLLRRFARWAHKIAVAQRQLADELAEELHRAEDARDPLGNYIVQARHRYLLASLSDKSKSGKKIDHELERSYVEAMNLGFKGSFALWISLMRMGKTPEQLAHEELTASFKEPGTP